MLKALHASASISLRASATEHNDSSTMIDSGTARVTSRSPATSSAATGCSTPLMPNGRMRAIAASASSEVQAQLASTRRSTPSPSIRRKVASPRTAASTSWPTFILTW